MLCLNSDSHLLCIKSRVKSQAEYHFRGSGMYLQICLICNRGDSKWNGKEFDSRLGWINGWDSSR